MRRDEAEETPPSRFPSSLLWAFRLGFSELSSCVPFDREKTFFQVGIRAWALEPFGSLMERSVSLLAIRVLQTDGSTCSDTLWTMEALRILRPTSHSRKWRVLHVVVRPAARTASKQPRWNRICRPGSILGPQQQFLCDMQQDMWQAGRRESIDG